MNPWQKLRQRNGWHGGYVEWMEGDVFYISVVFSWQLGKAYQRAQELASQGYTVRAGGPAVDYNPDCLSSVAQVGGDLPALHRHNPDATFTTRGCIRRCKFCIVPKIEGYTRKLPDDEWEPKPIVCDNNLLAAGIDHFDHVIDRLILSEVRNIDFNQGLDARLLTDHHAEQLVKLHRLKRLKMVRLAWDDANYESQFLNAYETLRRAKMPKSKIRVYVLLGYNDTPKDALYRLEKIWHGLKVVPNPMRYQPCDTEKKNSYVHPNWTEWELKKYMKYWACLRYLSSIPFDEFDPRRYNK